MFFSTSIKHETMYLLFYHILMHQSGSNWECNTVFPPKFSVLLAALDTQPLQMEWKKATGVLQVLLHVYTMYVLSVCLTQTFMLKFSMARVLVVEKLRESYSHHLLCATAGRKGMRPPLTGKSQGDFFRSLA